MERLMIYIIQGNPVALARPRFTSHGHVFDSQKHIKLLSGLQLRSQHEHAKLPPYKGPLGMDIIFFMPFESKASKKFRLAHELSWHIGHKDIDNMCKMVLDLCQATEIMFDNDCQVAQINMCKIMTEANGTPRTEFCITELENTPLLSWKSRFTTP
jgi:Holliday junction resolvase RusA-like endonuclease